MAAIVHVELVLFRGRAKDIGARPDRRAVLIGALAATGAGATALAADHDAPSVTTPIAARCTAVDRMISVRDWGAVGDGRSDDTAAVQCAYDKVAERGGSLFFPAGTYKVALKSWSRAVALVGEGPMATTLVPVGIDAPVLRATFTDARWELATIAELAIDGLDFRGAVGFRFGGEDADPAQAQVGRVRFERVAFRRLDRAIVRPAGNIGLQVSQCVFEHIGIAIECRSFNRPGHEMHAGTMLVEQSHFSTFDRAAFLIDNAVAGGQVTIIDCVFEAARGFLLYVPRFNGAGPQPGITLQRSWIENVAIGSNIALDGRLLAKAKCIFANACSSPIRVIDSPIGDVELSGTTVLTENCALDALKSAVLDAGAQLVHRDARQFSGLAPGRCASILGPTESVGLRTPWFRMAPPSRLPNALAGHRLIAIPGDGRMDVAGASVLVGAARDDRPIATSFAGSFDIALPANDRFFHRQLATVGADKFIVALYVYRLVGGSAPTLEINGERGLSGRAELAGRSWEMLVNVSRCTDTDANSQGFLLTGGSSAATLRVAAAALFSFDTLQEAMSFVNMDDCPAAADQTASDAGLGSAK